MSNIISSDMYRLRRGPALYVTFLGMLAIVVVLVITIALTQSQAFNDIGEMSAAGMSETDAAEMQGDLDEMQQEMAVYYSGAGIGGQMVTQGVFLLFLLPVVIMVFCADFTAGTYRNTLSYESNRVRVFFSKFILAIVLFAVMLLGMLAFSWLLGTIVFGAGSFSAAYFGSFFTTLLLQLPIYLAAIAVCFFLVSITRKSSASIAIYFVGFIGISIIFTTLAGQFESLQWLQLLDPTSGLQLMAAHAQAPMNDILVVVLYNAGIAVLATLLGVLYYRKADMP